MPLETAHRVRRQQCTMASVNVKMQLAADTMHVAHQYNGAHTRLEFLSTSDAERMHFPPTLATGERLAMQADQRAQNGHDHA